MARMDRTMESNPVQVGNRTTLGGGMDVTMSNRMEMTMARMDRTMESNPVQVGNRTTLGGGMDVTMAPTSNRVAPASSLSKTLVGGGMDITMDPTTGDYTRHG